MKLRVSSPNHRIKGATESAVSDAKGPFPPRSNAMGITIADGAVLLTEVRVAARRSSGKFRFSFWLALF